MLLGLRYAGAQFAWVTVLTSRTIVMASYVKIRGLVFEVGKRGVTL